MSYYSNTLTKSFCLLLSATDDKMSNWSSTLELLGQFFFLILAFVLILVISVYCLRLAAKMKSFGGGTNNMKLIETIAIGTNNFVHIVKVDGRYLILGSSKENVTLLTEASGENITEAVRNAKIDSKIADFQNYFKKNKEPKE